MILNSVQVILNYIEAASSSGTPTYKIRIYLCAKHVMCNLDHRADYEVFTFSDSCDCSTNVSFTTVHMESSKTAQGQS